jgi:Tol biopolymer transport system component
VIESVSGSGPIGTADYAVSDGGLLVYAKAIATEDRALTWIDRSGRTLEPIAVPENFGSQARLSPDGSRVAGVFIDNPNAAVGVLDVRRGTVTRLTHEGANRGPVWTPDGSRVVFGATVDGASGIFTAPSDGSARPRRLFSTAGPSTPMMLMPDGRSVLYSEKLRLYLGSTEPDQEKTQAPPLHEAPAGREGNAHVSPDGKWVAYTADDSGRLEAYVHALAARGRRERVSTNGASFVRWTSGGRELVYWNSGQSGNFAVTSVDVTFSPELRLGAPRELFVKSDAQVLDVTADGSRFLVWRLGRRSPALFVTVTDWFEELRRRAPATP